MSAPEARHADAGEPGVRLAAWPADVVELAAFRSRAADIARIAAARGLPLPALGASTPGADRLALCVRPARWLILAPVKAVGAEAQLWREACAGAGAVVDLSAGLGAFLLEGPAVREMLARACRLDLRPHAFPRGSAAATIMVQVPVTVAALEAGMLLLTPATTAQHLREWLMEAALPFGVESGGDRSI